MECKLSFLGLLIFENQLKPETTPVMKILKDANIRPVMVTGDNMLTALSVARDSDMIGKQDKIILLTVLPSVDDTQPPQIQWMVAADLSQAETMNSQTTLLPVSRKFLCPCTLARYFTPTFKADHRW